MPTIFINKNVLHVILILEENFIQTTKKLKSQILQFIVKS